MKQDKAIIRISVGKGKVTHGVWNVVITEGSCFITHDHIGDGWRKVEVERIERDTVHDYEVERGLKNE